MATTATGAAVPKEGRSRSTTPAKANPIAIQSRRPTVSPSMGPQSAATKIGAVALRVAASPTATRGEASAKKVPTAEMVP